MDDHDSLRSRGNADDSPPHAWRPGRGAQPAGQPADRTEVWRPEEHGAEPTESWDGRPPTDPRQPQRPPPGQQPRGPAPIQGYPGQAPNAGYHQPTQQYGAHPTQPYGAGRPPPQYGGAQPTQQYGSGAQPTQQYGSGAQPTQQYGQGYGQQGQPAHGGYPPQNAGQGYPGQRYPGQGHQGQGGQPGQGYGQSYDDGPQFGRQLPPGGPGGYGYEPPPRHNGPKSGTIIVALLGAVAAAIIAGVVIGFLRQSPDPNATLGPTTSTPVTTQSSAPAQATPSEDPGATTSPSGEAVQRIGWVEQPWTRQGMDFGILKGVSRDGDTVKLSFDRASFLVGKDAEEYFKKHPKEEPRDYALVNTNKKLRSFQLVADAEVYGTGQLGGSPSQQQDLTTDELVAKFQSLPSQDQEVLVWLQHREGEDGPVTYLAEQFTP
jgi:hypothetical protein